MLRTLFRSLRSQTSQKPTPVLHAGKRLDMAALKLVSGGAPKGGWLEPESQMASGAPKGGWY